MPLIGLTKQVSAELALHGVTVNSIAPGLILSNPETVKQWDSYGADGQARVLETFHTRRLGSPDDIASATLFLAATRRAGSRAKCCPSTAGACSFAPVARRASPFLETVT